MQRKNILITCCTSALLFLTGCKKDGYGPLSDAPADVQINVTNVYDYRPNATVLASKAANKITITLTIPAESGRTIKEVSKVSATANGNFGVIRDSTIVKSTGLYFNTPVAVNAATYTFTTTFDEYRAKISATSTPAAVPTSNALLARDFYFQLKLDNDRVIYPTSVRVWVVD
jgi:hypothetical protein